MTHRTRISCAAGSGDSWALAQAAMASRGRSPLVVITASAADAERLVEEARWFAPDLRAVRLPDWETLPYDHFSPHPDLVSERIAALYALSRGEVDLSVLPLTTALQRLAPKAYIAARTFFFKTGETISLDAFRSQLVTGGYTPVQQVAAPGEFALRGGLIDLFPMGSAVPYRIELEDNSVASIRTFDVDTQRSIYPVNDVRLLPAREFPLDKDGQNAFRQRFRERFEGDPSKSKIYKDVSNGIAPAGIEYYLPVFFDETATLADYLPANANVVLHGSVAESARTFWSDLNARYRLLRGDADRPLLEPRELYLDEEAFHVALKPFAQSELMTAADTLPPLTVNHRADAPLNAFARFKDTFTGRLLVCADSLGRRETMREFFAEHSLSPSLTDSWQAWRASDVRFALTHAPLSRGFVDAANGIAVITETELYADQVRQSRRRDARGKSSSDAMLRDLAEVKAGDAVVHAEHGIGRYQGLVTMDLGEGPAEFMLIEYDGGDKLYVPVAQLEVVSRYSGASPEDAPLNRLGSGQWEKARQRAMEQVRDTAAELLNLYAQRAARQGYRFPFKAKEYAQFAGGFAFEETPDQLSAITAVIEDMSSGKPMDRLVCGDVGFGKTEVAMRAAFIAVMAGKQVAILVPTTLLAEQHYKNFTDRFAEFPVRIAELSRFRSGKEIAKAVEGLAAGTVDIAIGTHRLVQKDVAFKNLGLVIIDEEHRFGVRQKEELKALRAEVDVLTLTATPIPRTLAMSLEGLRDFSVIATAPQRRLAIKTFVARQSDGLVREAVLRELKRGGQVYYLYNEVETIRNQYERLAKLLPEARIAIAHGQLPERELEGVMRDFYHQRAHILLCSTIIETGIDIPNANTIIIHRADRFGLAQLHQLRGRVGRSHHQAYAYLLTPNEEAVSTGAKKRLEAIMNMEDLGAGFYLAMHDLEIRGAGEVLGESQSGGIHDVGFTLYTDMLKHAVRSLKAGREPDLSHPLDVATLINLHVPALLPEAYVGDVHERLVIYKRLANCTDETALTALAEELTDRYGLLPDPAKMLLECHRLRLTAKPYGVIKVDAGPSAIVIQFEPKPPIEAHAVIHALQRRRGARLAGSDKVRMDGKFEQPRERIVEVKNFLKELGAPMARAA